MAFWLFKQEPGCYSYADLVRDKSTTWDGVANALAQKHLRAAKKGDRAFFYHTGGEKAVVGIMEVTADPAPIKQGDKLVAVTVKPVKKLKNPVPLAAIKAEEAFAAWELVRVPRLSVMPVSKELWKRVVSMSDEARG